MIIQGIIAEFIGNMANSARGACATAIMDDENVYIKRLQGLLEDVDDLEDSDSLLQMFFIFRNMCK